MFWAASSSGNSPVWATVLVARFVGGFGAAYVGFTMIRGAMTGSLVTGGTSQTALELTLLPALAGALVTGLAITLLLPSMSARSVSLGNAILAAVAGGMVPVIASLIVAGGLAASLSAMSVVVVAGASPVVSLLATIGSVAITAWMVQTSSSAGGERWRGRPAPADQSWSEIESIDRDGAELDERQAERGYWGGLYGSEDDPKP